VLIADLLGVATHHFVPRLRRIAAPRGAVFSLIRLDAAATILEKCQQCCLSPAVSAPGDGRNEYRALNGKEPHQMAAKKKAAKKASSKKSPKKKTAKKSAKKRSPKKKASTKKAATKAGSPAPSWGG
jgi:hypothetical protein